MTEAWLEELSYDECLDLLRAGAVGRIAVVVDEFPVILPVNYRLVETGAPPWIAVRTRPGNILDRASMQTAFEIDDADPSRHAGSSVLVRGTLHHAEREAWLVIAPFAVTGRRLHAAERGWAFHPRAYL